MRQERQAAHRRGLLTEPWDRPFGSEESRTIFLCQRVCPFGPVGKANEAQLRYFKA